MWRPNGARPRHRRPPSSRPRRHPHPRRRLRRPRLTQAAPTQDTYGDLMKLKELLDAGALTQAEFDAQKQKLLNA